MFFSSPVKDAAVHLWESLRGEAGLCCCASALFAELLHPSSRSELQTCTSLKAPNQRGCFKTPAFSTRLVTPIRASFQSTASTSVNELMLRWLSACGITWWALTPTPITAIHPQFIPHSCVFSFITVGACRRKTDVQQLYLRSLQDPLSLRGICNCTLETSFCY